MFQLILNEGMGNWREINEGGSKYQSVTVADVKRVAAKYLTKENRTVAIYTRKASAKAEDDADLAGLDPQQKAAVQQMVSRLKTASDPAKLQAALARMDEGAAQAPAEMKPVLDVVKKKLQARIAELENSKK